MLEEINKSIGKNKKYKRMQGIKTAGKIHWCKALFAFSMRYCKTFDCSDVFAVLKWQNYFLNVTNWLHVAQLFPPRCFQGPWKRQERGSSLVQVLFSASAAQGSSSHDKCEHHCWQNAPTAVSSFQHNACTLVCKQPVREWSSSLHFCP